MTLPPASRGLTDAFAAYLHEEPQKPETLWRCSEARTCVRQRAFKAQGHGEDRPFPAETEIVFRLGHDWHSRIQQMFVDSYQADVEVPVDWRPLCDLTGHADAVYAGCCVEIKTMNPAAIRRVLEEGPRLDHVTQGGLYACSPQVAADALRMVYVNRASGEMWDWMLDVHQTEVVPGRTVRKLVDEELETLMRTTHLVRQGKTPARVVPGVGEVEDPEAQAAPWQCRLCRYRHRCVELGPGVVSQ